jgi:hypothetical protein
MLPRVESVKRYRQIALTTVCLRASRLWISVKYLMVSCGEMQQIKSFTAGNNVDDDLATVAGTIAVFPSLHSSDSNAVWNSRSVFLFRREKSQASQTNESPVST